MAKKKTKKKGLSLQSKIAKQVTKLKQKPSNKVVKVRGKPKVSLPDTNFILSQARLLPESEALHTLSNVLQEVSIRDKAISCKFPKDFKIKSNTRYIRSNHGVSFDLAFESKILISFSKEISRFLKLSSEFDQLLLLSNLNEANEKLNEIIDEFGYSNWVISSKLNLHHEKSDQLFANNFRNSVADFFKRNPSNSLSETYSNYPFIRCDKGVSYERYSFSIQHQIEEYSTYDSSDIINFTHFYCPSQNYNDYSELIEENSATNIIDRYLGYRRILSSSYLNNIEIKDHIDQILKLSLEIDDKHLRNIVYLLSNSENIEYDDLDRTLLCICDLYLEGKYEKVVDECEKLFITNPTFISLNEIYIKSLIRCNRRSNLNNLLGNICNQIIELYSSQDKRNPIETLKKYHLRFYHSDWSFFIKLHFEKFFYGLETQSLESIYKFVDINSSLANPFSKIHISDSCLDKEISISQSVLLNNPSLISNFGNINEDRLLKIIGDYNFEYKNYQESLDAYVKLANSNDQLFSHHAKSKLISCNFHLGNIDESIIDLARLIMLGQGQNLLPINEIYNFIYNEDKTMLVLEQRIVRAIVLFQYYNLNNSHDGEILGLVCEDILEDLGICDNDSIYIPEGEFSYYFFDNVLDEKSLEKIDMFDSLEGVFIFRFYVLKALLEKNDCLTIRSKIFKSIESLIKEVCVTECGTGRIEADLSSIRDNLSTKLRDTFNTLKNSEKQPIKPEDYNLVQAAEGSYTITSNKYLVGILDLYYQIRDMFTLSPTYGLDNFLNMNIRHGGVVNLLWGPAKAHNLCYLKTEKGHFEKELYWFDHNPYIKSATRETLDESFRRFSKDLDKKIQGIKAYIHINTGEFRNNEKAFNYFSEQEFIESLYEKISVDTPLEEFIDLSIKNLIEETDLSLKSLKSYISKRFRQDISKIFDELHNSVSETDNKFDELKRKIKLAQREMNENIDILLSWMKWKNEASQSFLLGSALDSAKEMVLSLHPNIDLQLEIHDHYKRFIMGEHFRKFVMIFLILLDNSVIHSNKKYLIFVKIIISNVDNEILIQISNSIDSYQKQSSYDFIKNNDINKAYIENANKESGSGIFKIKKILSNDIIVENKVLLKLESDIFSVNIKFDGESIHE